MSAPAQPPAKRRRVLKTRHDDMTADELLSELDTYPMSAEQLRKSRAALGNLWGYGRPLRNWEMGAALCLMGRDLGAAYRDLETGKSRISGVLTALIVLYLEGAQPPWPIPEVDE